MSAALGGPKLDLTCKSGRRLGIRSKDAKLAPLHNISSHASKTSVSTLTSESKDADFKKRSTTPPRAFPGAFKKFLSEEDLLRDDGVNNDPVSDDSSGDERMAAPNIKPTNFGKRKTMQKPGLSKKVPQPARPTVYAQRKVDLRPPTRSARQQDVPNSSQSSNLSSDGFKRKSAGDDHIIGAGIRDATDPFKTANCAKRQRPAGYGSSQLKYGSSQASSGRGSPKPSNSKVSFIKPNVSDSESELELETPREPSSNSKTKSKSTEVKKKSDPDSITKMTFQSYKYDDSDDDAMSSFEIKTMKMPELLENSPQKPVPINTRNFIIPSSVEDSPMETDYDHVKSFQKTGFDDSFDFEVTQGQKPRMASEASNLLDRFSLDEEQSSKIDAMLGDGLYKPSVFEDEFPSMTQMALCPMCNQPVDPAELRKMGQMNIHKQEKFCQSHQRKTAQEDWEAEGYPEIKWEKLHSRILQHKAFIKELIKGKDCPSRGLLEEAVKTGKDRNLLKSTSNITPGYYGSRGLRAISESIMNKHTPLLKKCIISDNLISARGVTGFVQSVLVPEVTVLLIMEDMKVGSEKAREVLTDSVSMGELIHEEIRDVVVELDDSDSSAEH